MAANIHWLTHHLWRAGPQGSLLTVKPSHPFSESIASRARDADNLNAGIYATRILLCRSNVEGNVGKQVDLVQHQQFRFKEDRWILQRLVFPFRHAKHDDLCCFAEVVTRGTNEVAHVLDKEEVDLFEFPVGEMALNHPGIKVACAAGGDLLDWKAKAAQSIGIVLGLNVTGKDSVAFSSGKCFQSAFQKSGFSVPG